VSIETVIANSTTGTTVGCTELSRIAETELGAFIRAVRELHGEDYERLSAEDWLNCFRTAEIPLESAALACRLVSIAAAARLTERMAEPISCIPRNGAIFVTRCSQEVA
jgi:hypothetical protein